MANEVKIHLAIDGAAEVVQEIDKTGQAIGQTSATWQQNMRGVAASMRDTAAASGELSQSAQRIMDRYDPLGTKLRALTSDMATLRREMGDSTADGAIKAFQGLEAEIEKTHALMATAGVASADGFNKAAEAADKSMFATVGARRELMVLGHEAISGNFSKMPGSFMVLAERMDLTAALMNPLTLGLVAIGVAAVATVVHVVHMSSAIDEFNKSLALTGNYAGQTRDSIGAMANSIQSSMTGGVGKANTVLEELAATGHYTGAEMDAVGTTVLKFSQLSSESSTKVIGHFDGMRNGVADWAAKANESYHFLTAAQYEEIAVLERQDNKQQAVIQTMRLLNASLDEQKLHIGVWAHIVDGATIAWDALNTAMRKSIFPTVGEQAQKAVTDLMEMKRQAQLASDSWGAGPAIKADWDAKIKAQTEKMVSLAKAATNEMLAADAKANQDLANQRGVAAQRAVDDLLKHQRDNSTIRAEEGKRIRDNFDLLNAQAEAAGKKRIYTEDQINAAIAKNDLLYQDKKAPGTDTRAQDLAAALLIEKTEQDREKEIFDEREKMLQAYHSKLGMSDADYYSGQAAARLIYMSSLQASYAAEESLIDNSVANTPKEVAAKTRALLSLKEAYEKAYGSINKLVVQSSIDQDEAQKKAIDSNMKAVDAAGVAELKSLDEAIAKQREHNAEIGKTKEQIENLRAAKEDADTEDKQREEKAIKALLTESDLMDVLKDKDREVYERRLAYLDQIIAKRKENAALLRDGATDEAAAAAAKAATEEWTKGWDSTNKLAKTAFTDWSLQGTNVAKQIGDTLKRSIASAFYDQDLQPFIKSLYAAFTGGPSGSTGGTGFLSGLASLFGGGGSTGTVNSAAAAATAAGGSADRAALYGNAGYGSIDSGSSSGAMGALGNIPVVGWIAMGMMASGTAYDQGFRAQNGASALDPAPLVNDKTLQAMGMSGKTAAMFSGSALESQIVDAVFGAHFENKGSAYVAQMGTQGSSSVALRTDTQETGGVFGGGTTQNSSWADADSAVKAYIDTNTKASTDATKSYAAALGLNANAVDGFTKQITVSLTGLDAAGQQKAVDAAISGFINDSVTAAFGPAISALAKSGETSGQTLQRLAVNLTSVNSSLALLGAATLTVGVDSAATASKIVDAFGGTGPMQTAVTAYYNAFYSSGEKAANGLSSLNAGFAALGVTMPATHAAFRAMVDGLDTNTESGRKLAAGLLALAPAFDAVANSAAQAASVMASALADYGTSAEQRSFAVDQIRKGLAEGGVNLSDDQIANATRADARALWQQYTDAGNKVAADAILAQSHAFAAITTTATAATAAIGGGSGGGGGGGGGNTLIGALQSLTDSIFAEVQRIRGLIAGPGQVGYAQAQQQFAVATAQARAGDQTALAALPGLSQAMLTLAEANTSTLLELDTIRAQTAASLSTTGTTIAGANGLTIPQYAVGTNSVPQDMLALIHQGETIIPDGFDPRQFMNEMGGNGSSAAFIAAMNLLSSKLDAIAENTGSGAGSARSLYRLLAFCAPTGTSIQTSAAT